MVKIKRKSSFNKALLEIFPDQHPIAYLPCLLSLCESPTAALFMSQLLYWANKGNNPDWIYKTLDECQKETGLSRSAQDNSIKIWKDLGVLELKLKGVPCKRHFHINFELLVTLLKNAFANPSLQNSANWTAEADNPFCTPEQTTTESSPEISQKNTNTGNYLRNTKLQEIKKGKEEILRKYSM